MSSSTCRNPRQEAAAARSAQLEEESDCTSRNSYGNVFDINILNKKL
jgi:hypothetical protein